MNPLLQRTHFQTAVVKCMFAFSPFRFSLTCTDQEVYTHSTLGFCTAAFGEPLHVSGGFNSNVFVLQTVAIVDILLHLVKEQYHTTAEDITTKSLEPPTGDKRTYMSLATYCRPSNPKICRTPKAPELARMASNSLG